MGEVPDYSGNSWSSYTMSTNDASARRPRATLRAVVATPIVGFAMFASLATNGALPSADAKPPAVPTDSQGYLNSPARCDGLQRAVVIGRTPLSLVAICQDKGGAYVCVWPMEPRVSALLVAPALQSVIVQHAFVGVPVSILTGGDD